MSIESVAVPIGTRDIQLFLNELIEPFKKEILSLKAELVEVKSELNNLRKENTKQKERISSLEKRDIDSVIQAKIKYVNMDEAVFTALSRYKNRPKIEALIDSRIDESYIVDQVRALKVQIGMFAKDAMDPDERQVISHDSRISHLEEKLKNQPLITSNSTKTAPKIMGGAAEIRADGIIKELLSAPEKSVDGGEFLPTKVMNYVLRQLTGKAKIRKGQNIAQAKKEALAVIEERYKGIAYTKKVGQEIRVYKGSKA